MTAANTGATPLTPARIIEVGMAFWPAKTLLAAIKLGIFTTLGESAMNGAELCDSLGLNERSDPDFFDTLVALHFLERDGNGPTATYRNTPETAAFLDRSSPHFMGGFLEMANDRLYPFWGGLEEALRTGKPQNEIKLAGKAVFEELYSQPERLEQFMDAMAGISAGNF
ncbi:MAG: methyltransferase dimerization domain-containing protein [Acidobacteriota bacterium]